MKRVLSGLAGCLVLFSVLFTYNLYNNKVTKKPENKKKIQQTLKNVGMDDDTIDALDSTVDTVNNGITAINRAKDLIANTVSSGMIDDMANKASENESSDKMAAGEEKTVTDKTKKAVDTAKDLVQDEELRKEVIDEVKNEVENRAEELPSLSDEDIDEIVEKVTSKIKETCSDDNIKYYLQNKDIQSFNDKFTDGVTQDKLGFISDFMKKWIENIPSIESIDPFKDNK